MLPMLRLAGRGARHATAVAFTQTLRTAPRMATPPLRGMASTPWDSQPGPPRLPPEQQAEFERLVRQAQESAAAASLADAVAAANEEAAAAEAAAQEEASAKEAAKSEETAAAAVSAAAAKETPGLNGNPIEGVWRGAPPEFTGDRNPKTGEVGGPKNEPLRWGSAGDWSYNGRVTDF